MANLLSLKRAWVFLLTLVTLFTTAQAQQNCANTATLAEGYSVSISNVIANADGTYTITLTVANNGCAGCKKLNSFLVQAAPGTYSNVSVQVLYGPFTYANLALGPTLSGTTLTGFRINNANGMGNGQSAAFTVTYTVTTLQNQQIQLKAGSSTLNTTFSVSDFQNVLNCLYPPPPDILPYFDPYANKSYDIIGVELTSLYFKYFNGGSQISDQIFQIIGNSVRVTVRTQPGQHANARSLLTTAPYGLVQEFDDPANNLIEGTFPILNLLSLNQLPNLLVSVRPIYAPLTNVGLITSQGDTALRSFRARGVFNVDGTGVKVGVLSDSYNTKLGDPASDDVLKGDLPGVTNAAHPTPVQVLQEFPFGTRTDEGRAMLQIVHDVAPGAELAFRTGFLGAVDFAKGIRDLQQAGCDVVVDDISYITEPFFRDGVVAQAVNDVKAQGVTYFSAAGNFGTNSWEGDFAPVTAPAGVVGQAHDFNPGAGTDIYQSIKLYQGDYTIVFQWDDGTPGTATSSDFDIYLANNSGNTLFGFNRMNIGGDAFEILPFVVTADSVNSNIVIVRETGSAPARLKYVVYRGRVVINEYGTLNASTITGQANAAGAIAVGAVLYANTPEYGVAAPTPASFSSRGGTLVNGTDNRFKPDLCAPNGVNTSVDLGGFNFDGDAFPNFFGTSAAAPHASGVAALLIEARAKYYGDVLSPDGVKGILQNTAIDMGAPGYDVSSGAGYILADSALMSLANPSPFITGISYDTTLIPGVDTLVLTVFGEYIGDSATVWLDGVPLTSGVIIQGDSAIITLVEPFEGLYPEIQVYNPPMAGTNGTDGGLSNPLYFTTKETILITVDDRSKVYGEVLPAFSASYAVVDVDGSTPLAAAGLTAQEVARIEAIDLITIATAQSNVGLWAITTDPTDPLSPNSSVAATDSLDISLLQRYNVVVDAGLLTITPADLLITPRDTTFVYGDSIVGLQFDYLFNDGTSGSFNMAPSDSIAILNAVKSTHGTALVNATALVRGTALVNNNGEQLLTDSVLSNFSFMISQAVSITRGTALVNGELIDPAELYTATALTNAESRLVRGTALVNGYTLVRGTALVNTIDTLGNVTNTSSLTNSSSLVNNTGLLNSTTITLESNSQTLVILGDDDIDILSGNAPGSVVIRSVNLVTGNTVGTHLSLPGTFLSNNFNVRYGVGQITIVPDTVQFIIDPATLTQTYDGLPKEVGVTTIPDSVDFIVTYNGDTVPPVNAGTYAVLITVDDPNYVGSATATLVVQPAAVQVAIGSLTQTYDGSARAVTVTTTPAGVPYTVTYNGSATPPVNAGSYAVEVSVTGPNYVGGATATLVVQQATAQITLSGLTQTYDKTARTVNVTVVPAGVPYTLTYAGSTTAPVNAGSYAIQVTVTDPNYVGSASATLVVQKAPATVSTGIYVINKGQALPTFTATYSGFLPGDNASVVTSLTFSLSPNYNGQAGVYTITPVALAANYTFTPITGTLYVNPAGPGTKQVKPNFICYEVLPAPNAQGFTHVAWFNYENPNNTPVYIPVGPLNSFSGSARDASLQPTVFLPGVSAPIAFPYMGTSLTWQITSNKNNGTTGSIPANTSNVVCTSPGTRNMFVEAEEAPAALRAYPNPTNGRLFLEFSEAPAEGTSVELYNALGARCEVRVNGINDRVMDLDLSGLRPGMYIVRALTQNGLETCTVVIE